MFFICALYIFYFLNVFYRKKKLKTVLITSIYILLCMCKVTWHLQLPGWDSQKKSEEMKGVVTIIWFPDVWSDCFYKKLYEMSDIIWEFIGRTIICWYSISKENISLVDFRQIIVNWNACRLCWDQIISGIHFKIHKTYFTF